MNSKKPAAGRSAVKGGKPAASARTGSAPKRAVAPRRSPALAQPAVTPEERYRLIAEAAYQRAQRRGFAPGGEVQDWLDAEAEVNARLREG